MKTSEEIKEVIKNQVEDIWYNRRSINPVDEQTELLTDLCLKIQVEAWNEALERAANMVEMDWSEDEDWHCDKDSILKLKK